MSPASITDWLARGPQANFFVMYGATEAAARLTYLPPAELSHKRASIGRAHPGSGDEGADRRRAGGGTR